MLLLCFFHCSMSHQFAMARTTIWPAPHAVDGWLIVTFSRLDLFHCCIFYNSK